MAPNIPTQLCGARPANGEAAVFSDGSSGEYETRARVRKAAEMSNRKPTSSLSRRFDVGVNTRVRVVILALERRKLSRRFSATVPPAPSSAGRHSTTRVEDR